MKPAPKSKAVPKSKFKNKYKLQPVAAAMALALADRNKGKDEKPRKPAPDLRPGDNVTCSLSGIQRIKGIVEVLEIEYDEIFREWKVSVRDPFNGEIKKISCYFFTKIEPETYP